MAEIILNDPIAVRKFIFFEFLSGEPIWTCFKNFCYKRGKNAIEYQEFEYWFMRFSRKEYELDYDRSLNPPTRNIYNLPLEIMQRVLIDMNGKDRRNSALVCKKLHNAVSTLKPPYKDLQVVVKSNSTYFFINDYYYFNYYSVFGGGSSGVGYDIDIFPMDAMLMKAFNCKEDYQEEAISDIHAFLNQPRLELEKLRIEKVDDRHWNDFGAMFEQLQKVKTKEIDISTTERMEELKILPCLDPNFIEKIVLRIDQGITKDRMDKLSDLEQCRRVNMVEFILHFGRLEPFQIVNFMKFRRFTLKFEAYGMDTEKSMAIIKTLLTSTSLELVHLDCFFLDLADTVKLEIDTITQEVPENSRIRKFMIPNSKEYFETEFIEETVIRIERKG